MAILKGISNPSCKIGGSKSVLEYVGKKATLTKGLFCSDNWKESYQDFQNTKEFFNKENGRQYLHYVQSFKEGEVTPEEALEFTEKFCNKIIKDNEVFLAVHTDTKNIHCHMIVNSVSYIDGHKFQCSSKDLKKWKEISNEINKEHGLAIPKKTTEQGKIIAWKKEQYMTIKKSLENKETPSDSLNLVKTILEISKDSKNKNEFIEKMELRGYKTDWVEHKKNITFTVSKEILIGGKNKFRLNTLAKTFNHKVLSKEGLENEFSRTREQGLSKFIGREQSIKRDSYRLSEYQQETGFRTKINDGAIQQSRIISGESTRENLGLGRINTLDDKRNERIAKKLDEQYQRELESRVKEEQRAINHRKSKSYDNDFDIGD